MALSLKVSEEPKYNKEDLLGIISEDLKSPVDIKEIISRITDGSKFEEFKPLYGPTMVCGWSTIYGYQVGLIGNNGPIYPEAAEKAATFINYVIKEIFQLFSCKMLQVFSW